MAKDERPQDYKGPRTAIITKNRCGFCNSGDHDICKHELPYYEKLWICPCECNKNWVPQDLGGPAKISSTTKRKEKNNDERRASGEGNGASNDDGSGEPVAGEEVPDDNSDESGSQPEQTGDPVDGDQELEDRDQRED